MRARKPNDLNVFEFKNNLCFFSGSIDGGVDIVDKENVGVTNRVSFHELKLQNGQKYYVTVMGMLLY